MQLIAKCISLIPLIHFAISEPESLNAARNFREKLLTALVIRDSQSHDAGFS